MKKIIALLCALLLLSVSFASAEAGPLVEFRDILRLSGSVPDGYGFTLTSQTDLSLEGSFVSADPAAPVLAVYIAFNESYAGTESLKALGNEGEGIIKQGFLEENSVSFDSIDTASSDRLLVVREAGGLFLDFYTIRKGYEIELTLRPAIGQVLSEEQIALWRDCLSSLSIQPLS